MKSKHEFKLQLYRTMLRIRQFEEKLVELKARQAFPGLLHLYIGEEATATGICAALRQDDYITSTHRGHGHCIAKGADISRMMAELYGRSTGYCHGKGGSMHIADINLGILGANGIVSAGMPIAGGAALSIKMRGIDQVVASFFGDGAANQGAFHAIQDIYLRKDAYGMHGCMVDGNDVMAVYEAAKQAVDRARRGEGPTLIECKTYRWRGHYEGEADRTYAYRTKEEIEEWMKKCPIQRYRRELLEEGILGKDGFDKIEEDIQKEIEKAIQFAESSPFPNPKDALMGLYIE